MKNTIVNKSAHTNPVSFKDKILESGLAHSLAEWQKLVDHNLEKAKSRFGKMGRLTDACHYALTSGGKRFRPAIVHMVAEALGKNKIVSEAALAVEYFHTASLIADDLPCMDNDDLRRGRPSLHKEFGEDVALLASYALISEGYAAIGRNGVDLEKKENLALALESATRNTGALGATGGQYLDLYPPNFDKKTVLEVLEKKTVTLFELAFVLGWLFGGGEALKLDRVKKAAYHFGMAFQIADDLDDHQQDEARGNSANLAVVLGFEATKQQLLEEAAGFRSEIKALELDKSELANIIDLLVKTGV